MHIEDGQFLGQATGGAVDDLRQVLLEREKTRRLLIGAACLLFVVAALVVIFAPNGKQSMANVLGGALLVIALGAIGVAQFRLKAAGIELAAGDANKQARARRRQPPTFGPMS